MTQLSQDRTAAPVSIRPDHTGLTSAQVAERVKRGETNAFKARVGRTYWQIVRDNVFNLFTIVLGSLLIVVIILRDPATAFFAGFSLVTNSILGMYQEVTAKRKLDSLAALAATDIAVMRDGQRVNIPISQIVKDDVLPIEPGDKLVVDGRILESDALEIDESQLTGESDAVFKEVDSEVYSGSFCIAGSGLMVATKVGKDSTVNNLSTIAKVYKNVLTPTQKRIAAMIEVTVVIMLIIIPMLFLASYLSGQSLLDNVRNLVVFVSSIVPQGLVLTATLSLTIGAITISRFQTLIQRVNAVESMANVTVLCFDKTGTLTRNLLTVSEIIPLGGEKAEALNARLLRYTDSLSHRNRTAAAVADYLKQPSPLAPLPHGEGNKTNTEEALSKNGAEKLKEIPFSSARKWGAVVFPDETLIMGAPERILPKDDRGYSAHASELAAKGLRVLAFASASEAPPDGHLDGKAEPLALIVLSDQIRDDIQDTLNAFHEQNVKLKVISGDNLETVRSIALASGLDVQQSYTGDQLDAMNDPELEGAVGQANLFARIEPDTKRRIIAALKRQGEYVAMVGDGVNDVPALKEAHLAISMNDGAQISKDVAEIVLLNNAMSTLPKAFEEGKMITQTIFSTMKLFLTKNYYNIVLIFFIGFMTLPFPTTPIQISWITLGTVNLPATLIAFKLLRPQYMVQFRRDVMDYILIAGTIGAVTLALLYAVVYFATERDFLAARSAVTMFIALYGTLIYFNVHGVELLRPRTLVEHWRITVAGVVVVVVTMIVPYFFAELFVFIPPTPEIWLLIIVVFLLTAVLVYVFTQYRHLINQLWALFEK
ncbi:MAG: cation-translocating P-type ATPase [Anaerolineae bacterium]|nr:cation-translocating P-type ATPase [Anaerolineae bacterium]